MKKMEQLDGCQNYVVLLQSKVLQREKDEQKKPLAAYRAEELRHLQLNFYGFDPSYHVVRFHFVCKTSHAWTVLYLARHRRF